MSLGTHRAWTKQIELIGDLPSGKQLRLYCKPVWQHGNWQANISLLSHFVFGDWRRKLLKKMLSSKVPWEVQQKLESQ